MDQQVLKKTLSKAKIGLISKGNSTFLSTILFSLKTKWEEQIPTAGVDGINLFINPTWWLTLTEPARIGLLAHEAWHVAFEHILRSEQFKKEKYNRAADYVINLVVTKAGYTLPPKGLLDNKYIGMSTAQVYALLKDDPSSNIGAGYDCDIISTEKLTAEKKALVQRKVQDILVKAATATKMESAKQYSNIPGDIKLMIDELLNPKLDWKTILANYMTSFSKDDYSYKRPNKRYMPDMYIPTLYSESTGEVAVAVDTSGSVSDDMFTEFLTEINEIKQRLKPSLTTIIDFDTSIKNIHKLQADEDVTGLPFTGRGGTDLTPVFEYYNQAPPEVLIIFSDLYCQKVQKDPGYPVIWICFDNPNVEVNFGTLIHMEDSK